MDPSPPPTPPAPLDYSTPAPATPRKDSRLANLLIGLIFPCVSFWFLSHLRVDHGSDFIIDCCFLVFCLPLSALYLLLLVAACLDTPSRRRAHMRKLYDKIDALISRQPDFQPVDIATISRLPRREYARWTAEAQRHGFTLLGDIQDLAQARIVPNFPFIHRLFIDPSAAILGSFTSQRLSRFVRVLRFLLRQPLTFRYLSLNTYLSNGALFVTRFPPSNRDDLIIPSRIIHETPWAAGFQALLLRHRQLLAEYLVAHPGVSPLPTASLAAAIERAATELAEYQAVRRARGILLPEDLRKNPRTPQAHARQVKALQEVLAERAVTATPPLPRTENPSPSNPLPNA